MKQEELMRLARLAKLDFTEEALFALKNDMIEMLSFVDGVRTVNGELPSGTACDYENLRIDEVKESFPVEEIVSNVVAEKGFFPVRRSK